jgi:hypothetical protein
MAGNTSRAARHVEPERTCRPIAEAAYHIQRSLDFARRRTQPLEEARARFGWCDAARGAVKQPNAEPIFKPSYGFAQAVGATAARPCAVAEAARACNHHEHGKVAEV